MNALHASGVNALHASGVNALHSGTMPPHAGAGACFATSGPFSGRKAERGPRKEWLPWVVAEVLAARRLRIRPTEIAEALGITPTQASNIIYNYSADNPPLDEPETVAPLELVALPLGEESPRCRAVWVAVLQVTLEDACGSVVAPGGHDGPGRRQLIHDARLWFMAGGKDFRMVCDMAGLDPEAVRPRALAIIAAHGEVQP